MATLGTFDGYHLGHKSIFENLSRQGERLKLPPVAITFHPHPRIVVTPNDPPPLLTSPEEKIEILSNRFDGSLVFLKFDDNLRKMTAETFIRDILVEKFGIQALVVGYNHSFGRDRSGNIDHLAEIGARIGFDLKVVAPVTFKDMPISSSRIRRSISIGEWKDAINMLGHPYPIRGRIVKGAGRGRKLGWPTINLAWPERKLLPSAGVYSCTAAINGSSFRGMMFVGVNMFSPDQSVAVEANLFDFDRDVYDMEATLFPSHFIRANKRFDSPEELSRQIARDKEIILKLIH
ncbi:MAG: bifunctional riboflavin kinase/FAD synthetase [FCB group bacterium]|nr:bifunctional riboflavin kinase/FAD synthetase [FCB group bacterium]